MPNSAEQSKPVEAIIMLVLLFTAFGLLAWVVRHERETQYAPTQSITKPVNK